MTQPTIPHSMPIPGGAPVAAHAKQSQHAQPANSPAVVRRSVPVGAPGKSVSSLELITDANGTVQAIEVICSCGERHVIQCDYGEPA